MKKILTLQSAASASLAFLLACLIPQSQSQSASPAKSQAVERYVALAIMQRKIATKPPTIRVRKNEKTTLAWTSDEIVNIHLHGYDQLLIVKPGETVSMRIDASVPGRFPVSAHGYGAAAEDKGKQHKHQHMAPLMYLEVLPQ